MDGQQDDVIVESHGVNGAVSVIDCNMLRSQVKLLQNLHASTNDQIPFCLGFIHSTKYGYSLMYRAPTSLYSDDNRYDTLEAILSNPSHPLGKSLALPNHKTG